MKIVIPDYAKNYNLLPINTNEEAKELELEFGRGIMAGEDDYIVCWGQKPYVPNYGARYGVMETGFFYNGRGP